MKQEKFPSDELFPGGERKKAVTDKEKEIEGEKAVEEALKTGGISVSDETEVLKENGDEIIEGGETKVPAEALKEKEPRPKGQFFGGAARIKEGNKQTKKEKARSLEKRRKVIEGEKGKEPQKPAESQIKEETEREDREAQIKEIKEGLIFAIENGKEENEIEFWRKKLRKISGEDQLSLEELTGCIRNFINNLKIEGLNSEELKEKLFRISNLERMADLRASDYPEDDEGCQPLNRQIRRLSALYSDIREKYNGKRKEEPKIETKENQLNEVISELRNIESFKTEKDSIYSYDKDLKTTRFKTAENKLCERQNLTVFADLNEAESQNIIDSIHVMYTREENRLKTYVIEKQKDGSPKIIRDINQVTDPDRLHLSVVKGKGNKIIQLNKASLIPRIGYTVFDTRNFVDIKDKQEKTDRHLGHKVTEIAYKEKKEKVETKEKLPREIELEQRPNPLEGETYEDWLKRIGGPLVKVEDLKKCPKCGGIIFGEGEHFCEATKEQKKEMPLIINQEGELILNIDNMDTYFKKEEIDKLIEEGDPNIILNKEKGEYRFKKELFEDLPTYCEVIAKQLIRKRKIVADKRFGESIEGWARELEEKPSSAKAIEGKEEKSEEKEKPEKAEEPEKKKPEVEKKSLTLDEKISQKEKELEEIERKHNIYYSPVVKDLLGLYYDKRLKDVGKELKELHKERKKKPKVEDYFNHIKKTENLFNEMAKIRGAVKKREAKPEELENKKEEWRAAFSKTIDMEKRFGAKTMDKIREKLKKHEEDEDGEGLIKRKWNAFAGLIKKKFGKEVINETTADAFKEELKVIKNRLAQIPKEIKKGGVLGRSALEKEQKRLEKRLKKLKK